MKNYEDYIEKTELCDQKTVFQPKTEWVSGNSGRRYPAERRLSFYCSRYASYWNMKSWIVKGQFHCTSSKTQYSGKPFIPIVTETLVLFQKEEILLVPIFN